MHSEKVPYFILDLLQQVPFVYVPGLGRFEAIFHPAVLDPGQSRLKPPYLEPGFVTEATDTGELLPAYMHYVTGIEKEAAVELIAAFAQEVNHRVNSGEGYEVEKFGSFSKSPAGILHFTPDWDAFNLSFRGLESIDLELPVSSNLSLPEHEVPLPFVEPQPIREVIITEVPAETNWVTDYERPQPEIPPEKTPVETLPAETPTHVRQISDATSRFWWGILAFALFMITVLCAYLAWDILSNRKEINRLIAITSDSLSDASPDMIIVDTLDFIQEELPVDTPLPEPIAEPEIPVNNEKPCFVVVGAFSNSTNVNRMESRLNDLGYTTEKITGGSLTRVAIKTSCDQATLQKTLNDARSQINPQSWIY